MHGHDERKLCSIKELKSKFFLNTILTKTNDVFLDTKKYRRKTIKSFFPKKFNEHDPKEQTNVLLNAMQLYNYGNKIVRLFENKNIRPSMYAKSEPKEYDKVKKLQQKFESIGESKIEKTKI